MSIRYQLTELTPSGFGRRVYTDTLRTAESVARDLGGQWRLRRQYRYWGGRWAIDGGARRERLIGVER